MKPNRIILQLITVALILCCIFICACTGTENGGEDFAVSTSGETASAAVTDGDTSGEGNPDSGSGMNTAQESVLAKIKNDGDYDEMLKAFLEKNDAAEKIQVTLTFNEDMLSDNPSYIQNFCDKYSLTLDEDSGIGDSYIILPLMTAEEIVEIASDEAVEAIIRGGGRNFG